MGASTWVPPEPCQGPVLLTRTWRILPYGPTGVPGSARTPDPSAGRLYVSLVPEALAEGYEAIFPLLDERRVPHRHARSAAVLASLALEPAWAGKAVAIDPEPGTDPEELAALLDSALAGLGLLGSEIVAGARPFGGRSGLVFLRRPVRADGEEEAAARRGRLAILLGERGGD